MADNGSVSNPRDPVKSSGWNVAVQRRRQQAVMVSKKIRKVLICAKRLRKVGTNGDVEDACVENEVMIDEEQPILEAHTNLAMEDVKSAVQFDHLLKGLDHKTMDLSKEDEIKMTSSTSSFFRSWIYDVFPSFSGEDVRKSFLSHFLKELNSRLINTFIDHGIERSRPIGPELLLAIRGSRIAIVIFSTNYASSTWCLNELVEIHKCYKELNQMVIPIFYNVDPSEVRKQTGEFGKVFNKTCKGKTEDQKQRWMQALADIANMAGEDLHNWCNEADMIEKISNDVFNKLFTPSVDSDNFVGIEAHLEAMNQILCLGSKEARMVGILGPSGIGKTTIAKALLSQLSSQFHHRAFVSSRRRTNMDHYDMKLYWEQQLLSEILGPKDLKIYHSGMVEQRLKDKKILIFLDDVDDLELLNTLVGKPGWFGPGSRIIVITQDRRLLKQHEIHLIYEVIFPSEDLALKMFCRSAFGQNSPPPGFMKLAVEVAKLAGNLPLGLSVLGSSLKGMDKDYWTKRLPRLRNDLDQSIEKTLKVSYDRLDWKCQELFLHFAFANVFNGQHVTYIRDLLGDSDDTNIGLEMLADKSLTRITPAKNVEMHKLLQKLGREIVRAESIYEPGKRRFLEDGKDIVNVLTNKTGTGTVLGIRLNTLDLNQPLYIHKKAFKGMHNLHFLIIGNYWRGKNEVRLYLPHLPQDFTNLPSNLRLLEWYEYSSKCLPSNFKAEFLVELRMVNSKLEKLWEGGTQPLRSLKRMNLRCSRYLKEIPDLLNAINLEELDLYGCESLVTLPSWIQNAIKLRKLNMGNCTKLESLPTLRNLESLKILNLKGCFRLRNFPQVTLDWRYLRHGNEIEIEVEDCLWNKILHGVEFPRQFRAEDIRHLRVRDSMIEKLWEGVKSLTYLEEMDLSECENLKELPDLSTVNYLQNLTLNNCKSLVKVIGNQMTKLEMKGCTRLESVNLSSVIRLDLSGCKRLRSFPQISRFIMHLNLNDTAIEEVPCCIANFLVLSELSMRGCRRLKNISPNIFRLRGLERADFSECVEVVTALGDASMVETTKDHLCSPLLRLQGLKYFFKFNNCFNLNGDARELILRSFLRPTFLPGGNVPKYFKHRSSRNYLTVTLPQSSLSQEFLRVKACVVLEPITNPKDYAPYLKIRWHFRGVDSWQYRSLVNVEQIYNTDHLVLVSLKFRIKAPPSELDYNDVKFESWDDDYVYEPSPYVEYECSDDYYEPSQYVEFECSDDDYEPSPYVEFEFSVVNDESDDSELSPFQRIKGCGIRVLDVSPSLDGSDGSKKLML